ncbi:hypothetical protein KI387_018243, partial [Taxus chinensis]
GATGTFGTSRHGSAEKPPGGPNYIWDNRARSTRRARKANPAERRKLAVLLRTFGTKRPEPAGSAEMSTGSQKPIGTSGPQRRESAKPAEKSQVSPKQSGTSGPKIPEPAESAEMSPEGP